MSGFLSRKKLICGMSRKKLEKFKKIPANCPRGKGQNRAFNDLIGIGEIFELTTC